MLPDLDTTIEIEQPAADDTSVRADVMRAFEQHAAGEEPQPKADRTRDEQGRFAAKDTTVEPQPERSAPEPKITDADPREEQAAAPSTAPSGPPTSWSAEAKAEWSKLSPAAQQAVSKREAEINEGGRQWSEQRQNYERALSPVAELAQQYQMPVDEAVKRLVTVERRLGNPAEAPAVIAELAQAYGVNLAALVNSPQQPGQGTQARAPVIDPSAINRYLDQTVSSKFTAYQQQQEVASQIGKFADERDAAGKPAHPFFNEKGIQPMMGQFLQSGQATDMQTAYEMAVWATPGLRQQLLASQQQPQIEVRQQQVNKAKRAAVSINGAPGNSPPKSSAQANGGSVRDDVLAAWSQHAGA